MKFDEILKLCGSFVKKNSPYILAGTGAVSIAAGSVILAKKVKKSEIVEEKKKNILEEARAKNEGKVLIKAYTKVAFLYTKHYIVPIALLTAGVFSMATGTFIQTKRLKALSAAYTSLASTFAAYRERVKDAIGEDAEKDIYHNIKRDENGDVIKANEVENNSEFSRLYGDGNTPYWSKDPRACVSHILGAEANCNAILRSRGFITLNEVYEQLGFEPSEEGMYLGWRFKYGDPIYGSTFIDFGFAGKENEEKREDLIHSWNQEFWIDLVPPHSLFGKLPQERRRTAEQKLNILRNRRACHD